MTDSERADDAATATAERPGDAAEMTLESFVEELHQEGVEAGRKEADALIREAEAEAESIVRQARSEAEELMEEARRNAEEAGSRGRAELELAVRDAILQLQAALTAVLETLVARAVEEQLTDPDQLKPLVRDVVVAYARADAAAEPEAFTLTDAAAGSLREWWAEELGRVLAGEREVPELQGTLGEAGFEYRVHGATVDVTAGSVVEQLMELVRPGLREVVEQVAREAVAEVGASEAPVLPGAVGTNS